MNAEDSARLDALKEEMNANSDGSLKNRVKVSDIARAFSAKFFKDYEKSRNHTHEERGALLKFYRKLVSANNLRLHKDVPKLVAAFTELTVMHLVSNACSNAIEDNEKTVGMDHLVDLGDLEKDCYLAYLAAPSLALRAGHKYIRHPDRFTVVTKNKKGEDVEKLGHFIPERFNAEWKHNLASNVKDLCEVARRNVGDAPKISKQVVQISADFANELVFNFGRMIRELSNSSKKMKTVSGDIAMAVMHQLLLAISHDDQWSSVVADLNSLVERFTRLEADQKVANAEKRQAKKNAQESQGDANQAEQANADQASDDE